MNSFVLYPAVKICRVRALKVPTFGSHYFLRPGDQFSLSHVTCDQEFFFGAKKKKLSPEARTRVGFVTLS